MKARTACSGVEYVGRFARLRMRLASRTDSPPIQALRTGFLAPAAASTSFRAVSFGSVIACGVKMARAQSTPSSSSTVAAAAAYRSGGASPRTSTGFLRDQWAGRIRLSSFIVESVKRARTPPRSIKASVAITPGPPALVTMARRSPRGSRSRARSSAQSNMSSELWIRTMPARSNAASYTASSPAMAPVWDAAAFADSGNRPAL